MSRMAIDAPAVVIPLVLAAGAYFVVLWVALAYWMVRDARLRSPSPTLSGLAAVLGLGLPFFGALVYLVIRPPRTIDEERALALEEQALVEQPAEISERPCPTCGREIERDFVVCPYCRTQFAQRCHACQRSLRLGWRLCPYCATELGLHDLSAGRGGGTAGRAASH